VAGGRFVDAQALSGDAVDNVSGVRGIGMVTACKLIDKYDTV
jgi:5'-3' exonuclease